jgi:hypothetical protein
MFTIFNLTVDQQALNYGFSANTGFAIIMQEWADRAGPILIEAIREILGHDAIYQLSYKYSLIKPNLAKFRRVSGKDSDQPLILSGEHIYDALEFHATSDGFLVQIPDSKSHSDTGFPIAEYWESQVGYLEQAFTRKRQDIEQLLEDIIYEKLGLI